MSWRGIRPSSLALEHGGGDSDDIVVCVCGFNVSCHDVTDQGASRVAAVIDAGDQGAQAIEFGEYAQQLIVGTDDARAGCLALEDQL